MHTSSALPKTRVALYPKRQSSNKHSIVLLLFITFVKSLSPAAIHVWLFRKQVYSKCTLSHGKALVTWAKVGVFCECSDVRKPTSSVLKVGIIQAQSSVAEPRSMKWWAYPKWVTKQQALFSASVSQRNTQPQIGKNSISTFDRYV